MWREKIFPGLVKQSTFTYTEKKKDANGNESEEVTTSQIDYKGVNYIGLIPALVSAIQEQQKEIEDLKLQVSRLAKQ